MFLKHSILQVDCDLLLPSDLGPIVIIFVGAITECILVVEPVNNWNATLSELTFHKQLTIFATLGPQLDLTTIATLKIIGQLGLALVSVKSS